MNLNKIFVEQHDSNDCGAACIAMVCRYYGKDFTITKLRDILGTDINGTPINGLHHGAEQLGFDVKKVRITQDVIHEDFTLPAICHVRTPEGGSHFVVLFKVKKSKVVLLDPARGIVKYSINEFFGIFDGLILFLYPREEFARSKEVPQSIFKKFIALLKPQKKLFIYAIIGGVLLTLLGIFSSLFNKVLMDEILPYQLKDLLLAYSLGFGAVVLARVFLSAVRQQLVLYLSQRIDLPLMLGYFQHVFRLPINFFANRKIGDITTRFQDAFVIKNILTSAMLTIIIDVALAVITAVIMAVMSWKLFLVILVITILSAVLIYSYKGVYKRLNKKQMEQNARLNANIIESLKGVETIKANSYERNIIDKVENEYVKSLKIAFSQGLHSNIQNSFSQAIAGVGNIVLMALGVLFAINGDITMGTVLAFFTIAGYFMEPIGRLIELQLSIQEAGISLKRLSEIQEIDEEEIAEKKRKEINKIDENITIKNLTFRYGSRRPVLKNINLEIPKGQKVAIVGPSGSGKTTLSKLLLKFYKTEEGEIFFGDNEISTLNAFSLRECIGYVPQNIETFSGTIIDNIRIGKEDATVEEIQNICEATGCGSFINIMPFGYDTFLDETGGGLSGGEKQRLALARALIKKPKFVILDEATSNLDFNTENEVFKLLFEKQKNTTMLIIAHRLGTIRNCDRIYVFDNGTVAESGTHESLLRQKGLYYKLWLMQIGTSRARNQEQKTEKKVQGIKEENIIEY